MQQDNKSTISTAPPGSDPKWTTLTGRDHDEYCREVNERLKGVKPFKNDAEFFAYARARWDARQKAEQAADSE